MPVPGTHARWRSAETFRVGDVEIRPASNEIVTKEGVVRVKPRLMEVLLRLAFEPGQVVSRHALLDDVWPRRMVNDDVLSRVVADLRVALHDDAREARYIETLPKAGYRLIAPVVRQPSPGAAPGATPAPVPAARPSHWAAYATAAAVAVVVVAALLLVPRPDGLATQQRATLERQLAGAEPFVSDPGNEVAPRFSADGALVAFAQGDGDRSQIVIRDVASKQQRRIGNPAALNHSPVFFPDGKRIAYFRKDDRACAIVEYNLDSGIERLLVECPRTPRVRFDLAPDGQRLVYVAETRPQFPGGLRLRDLATGSEQALTAPEPGMGDDVFPRFSPDGQQIAFFRGTESHRQLWFVSTGDPASARSSGSPRGLSYGAAWLGNSGPLVVAADWFGFRALNLFEPGTGKTAVVGARGARFPDADARGNLVYENAAYQANLFLVDIGDPTGKPQILWPSTRYTNQPEIAPDGKHVVFVSNRDGAQGIFLGALGGDAARLPLSDDFLYMRPHWSRDGNRIYAVRVARRPGAEDTYEAIRIAFPDGSVEVLGSLGTSVFDVREADETRSLLVGEHAGNAARLLRVRADASAPLERLPLPLASEYQVAGGSIAFTQPQLPGITLCSLASLHCEPLAVPVGDESRYDWLLTPQALWYIDEKEGKAELVRYDLSSRSVRKLPVEPTGLGLSAAVSPDGLRIILSREEKLLIDLVYARRPPS